ncbi:hypothetical protein LJC40_02855 [Synergistaceae bacterium OttesenSCG-928-D05]|nr:hypothetical protein [Synergistaceae bacterium OttesenSCG-928-D05]
MAVINKTKSNIQMILSLGMKDGKEIQKSVPISNLDVNADVDTLLALSTALAPLLAHPVVTTKHNATGILVE